MIFRYLTRLGVACSVVLFVIHVALAPLRYDGISAASLGYARSAFELIFLSLFNLAVFQSPPRHRRLRRRDGADVAFHGRRPAPSCEQEGQQDRTGQGEQGQARFLAGRSSRARKRQHDVRGIALDDELLGPVEDELVPVLAQPDGSIAAWRIPSPRTFSLRSTFEF